MKMSAQQNITGSDSGNTACCGRADHMAQMGYGTERKSISRKDMDIRYLSENEQLTIFLNGRIETENSEEINRAILEIREKESFKKMILDFTEEKTATRKIQMRVCSMW